MRNARAAELAAGVSLARALLSGALTIAGCSRQVLGTWDLDDVIYPGLPDDLKELVLICFLRGTEHYAPGPGRAASSGQAGRDLTSHQSITRRVRRKRSGTA